MILFPSVEQQRKKRGEIKALTQSYLDLMLPINHSLTWWATNYYKKGKVVEKQEQLQMAKVTRAKT